MPPLHFGIVDSPSNRRYADTGGLTRRSLLQGLPALATLSSCATTPTRQILRSQPPAKPGPEPAPDVPPVFYTLNIEGRDLGAEIFLNDVLIDRLDAAGRASASTTVNPWLVPGENRLRIRTLPGHQKAGTPGVEARLGKRPGDSLGAPEVLATLRVVPPRLDATADETATFRVDPAPPARLWTQAEALSLDGDVRAAAGQLARELERAFARKDLAAVTKQLQWKTDDIARASFRDPEIANTTQRELLETLFEDPGYTMDYFTPEALVFELCAKDRLLRVARPTGPALQIRLSQGGRFRLALLLGKIAGRWTIVR